MQNPRDLEKYNEFSDEKQTDEYTTRKLLHRHKKISYNDSAKEPKTKYKRILHSSFYLFNLN